MYRSFVMIDKGDENETKHNQVFDNPSDDVIFIWLPDRAKR